VAVDLLSISPLIFRGVRRKLLKTTLADIHLSITPLHFEIISLLEAEGTLHVAEIGERLQIARAQMTQLLDKLVDLHIVTREMDTADRRTLNITLTGQGRDMFAEHKNSITSAVRETMSRLTDEDLDDLSDSLRKLRDILSKLQ
ncbi:MarR family winged helix-turn-helix transcriptional regulator, partial [Chloroflexota bacterium]